MSVLVDENTRLVMELKRDAPLVLLFKHRQVSRRDNLVPNLGDHAPRRRVERLARLQQAREMVIEIGASRMNPQ